MPKKWEQSLIVLSANEGCCEYCQDEYGTDEFGGVGDTVYDIEDTDNLPPLHPNCRCTPVWSMKEPGE